MSDISKLSKEQFSSQYRLDNDYDGRKRFAKDLNPVLWSWAKSYGIKEYHREKVLDVVAIRDAIMSIAGCTLDDVIRSLEELSVESPRWLPRTNEVTVKLKQVVGITKRSEVKVDHEYDEAVKQVADRAKTREDLQTRYGESLRQAIAEYCHSEGLLDSPFFHEQFFADYLKPESKAKAILSKYDLDRERH